MFEGDSFVRNVYFALHKLLEGRLDDRLAAEKFSYPKSSAIEYDNTEAEMRRSQYTAEDLQVFNTQNAPHMQHVCPPSCDEDGDRSGGGNRIAEITIWEEQQLWSFTDQLWTGTEASTGNLRIGGHSLGSFGPRAKPAPGSSSSNNDHAASSIGWLRFYPFISSIEHFDGLEVQVRRLKPDVLVLDVPSIHDLIAQRDPVTLAQAVSKFAHKIKHEHNTRVIYLPTNLQDSFKKAQLHKSQDREWSARWVTAVVTTLMAGGVEILDTISMADPSRHGNVLSGDGTHTWGFVDVMKARLLLAALCAKWTDDSDTK